jgi:hypothetical protein
MPWHEDLGIIWSISPFFPNIVPSYNDIFCPLYLSLLSSLISSDDLHKDYKQDIFGNKSDDEIKAFIYKHLDDASSNSKDFAFGKYLSFINLTTEQKKAFRHALFLQEDDLLRKKVIESLQNRNRAIVNGTQRYLAQCIADKIIIRFITKNILFIVFV